MMHYTPLQGTPLENGDWNVASGRHRDSFAEVEAAKIAVRRAMRAADASLRRLNAVAEPHNETNAAFVVLLERHRQDREMLFSAMRRLDAAQDALRRLVSGAVGSNGADSP